MAEPTKPTNLLTRAWKRLRLSFVSTEWQVYDTGNGWACRRRVGDKIETRPCTKEEHDRAYWHWAVR